MTTRLHICILTLNLFATALLVTEVSSAQGASNNTERRMPDAPKALPGTYRLMILPGGEQEFFPEEVLVLAEQLRRDHETIRYPLSSFVTIEIFSRDELRNRNADSARLSADKPVDHEK